MRNPTRLLPLAVVLVVGVSVARAEEPQAAAKVTVPLSHYLELQERIRSAESHGPEEPALAEVVSQQTEIRVEDESTRIRTVFEVEVRGDRRDPVALPLTGFAAHARVEPATGAALHRTETGRLVLVPRGPGSYRVEVEGGCKLERTPIGQRLVLAASGAPVATTDLDLPADLEWRSPGAVLMADEVTAARRRIRLALPRAREQSIDLGRQLDREPTQEALVQTSLVTVLDLDPAGSRRHDIVLYEVLRGEVSSFELSLPPGLTADLVGSDEGEVIPVRSDDRLTVHRAKRLTGIGYVAVTSQAPGAGVVSLEPVRPSVPVRSHYLVLAASVAADVVPEPQTAWVRVDLDDLPAAARGDLRALRPTAAWRRVGNPEEAIPDLSAKLDPLPPVPLSRTVVTLRRTTTLLTREGSLVHQDRFTARRVVSAFDVQIPPGMRLWSASVDGREVRPVVRGDRLSIPLHLQGETEATVEVVVLEEERLPERRSEISVTLPRVDLPVLEHQWRLLLPETHRYRYQGGTLAVATSGAAAGPSGRYQEENLRLGSLEPLSGPKSALLSGRVTEPEGSGLPGVTVTVRTPGGRFGQTVVSDSQGNYRFPLLPTGRFQVIAQLDGFQTEVREVVLGENRRHKVDFVLPLATVQEEIVVTGESSPAPRLSRKQLEREAEEMKRQSLLSAELDRLNQGLVGGVRPLPVEIPETGKLLFLTGALPPREISATVAVKGR